MPEGQAAAYDKGVVDQTLRQHGDHLAKINGSMADVAKELKTYNEGVQEIKITVCQLADRMAADAATVIATARALKDAEDARRERIERSWAPITKLFAVVSALLVVMNLIQIFK